MRADSPIIKIIVAKESDIRHENTCIDVKSVIDIEVIAGVGFRNIAVSIAQVPLTHCGAGLQVFS